jgi:hypothetical protein
MARSLARLCASHAGANRNVPGKIDVEELFDNTTRGFERYSRRAARGLGRSRTGLQLHDRVHGGDGAAQICLPNQCSLSRLGVDKLNRLCTRAAYRGEVISKPELPDRANRSKKSQENTLAEIRVVAPSPI